MFIKVNNIFDTIKNKQKKQMKASKKHKLQLELFILFIVFPLSLTLNFLIWLKLVFGLVGFLYIFKTLISNKYIFFKSFKHQTKKQFTRIAAIFIGLIFLTTSYIYCFHPEKLFSVVLQKPLLWITIIAVYSLLSVVPQEIIFRSFYFSRYRILVKNEQLFLLTNALLFSLSHIFFKNVLVLALTFIGGYLFAYTYSKTKSLIFVSLEHIIYGCWLFTVGMGDILGFPS